MQPVELGSLLGSAWFAAGQCRKPLDWGCHWYARRAVSQDKPVLATRAGIQGYCVICAMLHKTQITWPGFSHCTFHRLLTYLVQGPLGPRLWLLRPIRTLDPVTTRDQVLCCQAEWTMQMACEVGFRAVIGSIRLFCQAKFIVTSQEKNPPELLSVLLARKMTQLMTLIR